MIKGSVSLQSQQLALFEIHGKIQACKRKLEFWVATMSTQYLQIFLMTLMAVLTKVIFHTV